MTEQEIDIHNHELRLVIQRKKIRQDPDISPRNKELILEFEKALMIKNLTKSRILKYLVMLGMISKKLGKDFDKATKEDIKDLILNEIEYGKCCHDFKKDKEYTEWTKKTYKIFLKRFYQWLYNCPDGEYPDIVKWFKTSINWRKVRQPQPSELVTEEDVQRLISVCDHRRDKAIISLLAESGMRISELGGLRVKDLVFDEIGAIIRVIGKMGDRTVRVIASVPYIKEWLKLHKFRDDTESPLWLKLYDKGVKKGGGDYTKTEEERQIAKMPRAIAPGYATYRSMLIRIFDKAGFDRKSKKFNPHSFRHARASELARHITEHQMDSYFGWVVGSRMASHYVHLSGKSLDVALQKFNGIPIEEEATQSKLKPKICPRCRTVNEFERKFCKNEGCHSPLDLQAAITFEDELKKKSFEADKNEKMMQFIMQMPEIREAIIKQLGLR